MEGNGEYWRVYHGEGDWHSLPSPLPIQNRESCMPSMSRRTLQRRILRFTPIPMALCCTIHRECTLWMCYETCPLRAFPPLTSCWSMQTSSCLDPWRRALMDTGTCWVIIETRLSCLSSTISTTLIWIVVLQKDCVMNCAVCSLRVRTRWKAVPEGKDDLVKRVRSGELKTISNPYHVTLPSVTHD